MAGSRLTAKRLEPLLDVTELAPDADRRAAAHVRDFAARYAPCAHLDLGNVCNLGCVYCGLDRAQATFASTRTVIATLEAARATGLTRLALVGGEPTVRRDLVALVAAARGHGFDRVVLTTNGLLLANGDLLERLLDAGLTSVHLSLDDYDDARLCALARHPQAGRLVLQAVQRLLTTPALGLFLYAVLVPATLPHVAGLVEQVHAWSASRGAPVPLVMTAPKPIGRAWERRDEVLAEPAALGATVSEAHARAAVLGVPTLHRNLPDCLVPDWRDRAFEAALVERRRRLSDGERVPAERSDQDRKGPPCAACGAAATCAGVPERLVERFGWSPYSSLPAELADGPTPARRDP